VECVRRKDGEDMTDTKKVRDIRLIEIEIEIEIDV